jgi:hypothetical protein
VEDLPVTVCHDVRWRNNKTTSQAESLIFQYVFSQIPSQEKIDECIFM